MKINLKTIFGFKPASTGASVDQAEIEYDKHVDFYYSNIINSIVLYTYNAAQLEDMSEVLLNPLTELYEELEYAFTPVCFETVFRLGVIDSSLKNELFEFKNEVHSIPREIWDWKFFDSHDIWITIRQKANILLDKLGVESRTYNEDYTSIYDQDGNIIRKGKKV